jgi:hypothetical protein
MSLLGGSPSTSSWNKYLYYLNIGWSYRIVLWQGVLQDSSVYNLAGTQICDHNT